MPATDPIATPNAPVAPPEKFRKLPGRATTFRLRAQGVTQLYLASTYLVQVEVIRLREAYMKFAYKDIQAIEICRTSRGSVYNAILGVLAAFPLLGVLAATTLESRTTLGAIGGFFAVLLLINIIRGATCRCILQTATGRHRLQSLTRIKPARRAMALITERVAAVQGALDQATAAHQMEDYLLRCAVQQRERAGMPGASVAAPGPTASAV